MVEENDTAGRPTAKQLASAGAFVARHGGSARGVVEPIGRSGARVVLVGADGALGDVMVRDAAAGDALVAAVDGLEAAQWDSDTVAATVIGPEHRRRMAAGT